MTVVTEPLSENTADVIVVGAGPAGSSTAYHLAKAGLDVLLLEKTQFPREKVCGDGLTPRAVKQLVAMGIDISEEAGWLRNKGLRIIGGGVRLQLDWPDLASFPDYGLVRKRDDFDEQLARNAQKAGARLYERCNVSGPIVDDRTGRITGVTAKLGEDKREVSFHAPLVVAADGNSTRLSLAMGLHRREDRPMGVAVRTYFTSPRHDDDYLESWLELWDRRGPPGPAAARLRLDLRHGRRHLQRRPRRPQHLRLVQGAGLARGAEGLVRLHAGGLGVHPGEHDRPHPRRRPCPWPSTGSPTTPRACCSSATPAGSSTRSTVRASPTPWSPGRSPPTSSCRPTPAPPPGSGNSPCVATRAS
ncbi:hypothetical protein GCM10020256_31310 [Streptomyces thermocoprophilus]